MNQNAQFKAGSYCSRDRGVHGSKRRLISEGAAEQLDLEPSSLLGEPVKGKRAKCQMLFSNQPAVPGFLVALPL